MNRAAAQHRSAPRAATFRLWDVFALHRQRRALANLDDRLLDDIGVSRDDARHEAKRQPWEAPAHWLR